MALLFAVLDVGVSAAEALGTVASFVVLASAAAAPTRGWTA